MVLQELEQLVLRALHLDTLKMENEGNFRAHVVTRNQPTSESPTNMH